MLYWLANLIFQRDFIREIKTLLYSKKNLIIFDVGCYKGVFTKKILINFKNKIKHIYLFDVNRGVKNYISRLILNKLITYNECALTNKSGKATFYQNQFFESAGSSLSKLVKNDKIWNFTRRLFIGDLFGKKSNYLRYQVKISSLDNFVKKNKIKYIDICKVDIEGSELDFLKGSEKTLKSNKVKIFCIEIIEKKKFFNNKEKRIINLLKKYNFKLIKKSGIYSVSFLSNLKGGDYLFFNKTFLND